MSYCRTKIHLKCIHYKLPDGTYEAHYLKLDGSLVEKMDRAHKQNKKHSPIPKKSKKKEVAITNKPASLDFMTFSESLDFLPSQFIQPFVTHDLSICPEDPFNNFFEESFTEQQQENGGLFNEFEFNY